jgi:hypothetical protein
VNWKGKKRFSLLEIRWSSDAVSSQSGSGLLSSYPCLRFRPCTLTCSFDNNHWKHHRLPHSDSNKEISEFEAHLLLRTRHLSKTLSCLSAISNSPCCLTCPWRTVVQPIAWWLHWSSSLSWWLLLAFRPPTTEPFESESPLLTTTRSTLIPT